MSGQHPKPELAFELPESDVRGKPFYGEDAPSWRLARFAKNTLGKLGILLYRSEFLCAENIPDGGCILAGNHTSTLDPVMIYGAAPKGMIHFVAKKELWKIPLLGWAVDHLGAIPVYRGTADRTMIKTVVSLLKAGEHVGIYPEGTRVRGEEDHGGHGGAAFLAIMANAPVVPCGIAGADQIKPVGKLLPRFPKVVYRFGPPIHPADFEGTNREKVLAMTEAIMDAIIRERDLARQVSEGRVQPGKEASCA